MYMCVYVYKDTHMAALCIHIHMYIIYIYVMCVYIYTQRSYLPVGLSLCAFGAPVAETSASRAAVACTSESDDLRAEAT